MEYEYHYSRYPSLRAYIDRIGAEQLNFRRFMVKEFRGSHYYIEKVLIKIMDDFSIDCRNPAYAPTEEEAAAITSELSKVEFPHSIRASTAQVQELVDGGQVEGNLYSFYDNARKEVIMCQERRETDKGKVYILRRPAPREEARFSKADLRRLPLPFLGNLRLEGRRPRSWSTREPRLIYFAYAATHPERREERKRHPWIEQLTLYEHWGAIGGALAIHRCDYEELRREQIQGDLVYVSDNDHVGKEAVKVFSRLWGGVLYNIKFDNKFKAADLASSNPCRPSPRRSSYPTPTPTPILRPGPPGRWSVRASPAAPAMC